MTPYFLVGGGAAIGAILRYDATKLIKRHTNGRFPVATLVINLLAALILGGLASHLGTGANTYLLLGTGVCGGFSTFSTMSYEALLLQQKKYGRLAFLYLSCSLIGGLICVLLGLTIGQYF
ncbi:fluoride efflux transporter FluC [Loigolactobacillus zhaoyuanensis]|uniref:Fluoride-specific ion channel FluC n=1 Tax=Loigolactobacillus zhaoyuanensis TaxID=2486017 RepID=A0ABW8UIR6_9LACO|nr:CrcB family protein [Loigolactobacillus zhaoyuanensis]